MRGRGIAQRRRDIAAEFVALAFESSRFAIATESRGDADRTVIALQSPEIIPVGVHRLCRVTLVADRCRKQPVEPARCRSETGALTARIAAVCPDSLPLSRHAATSRRAARGRACSDKFRRRDRGIHRHCRFRARGRRRAHRRSTEPCRLRTDTVHTSADSPPRRRHDRGAEAIPRSWCRRESTSARTSAFPDEGSARRG